MSTMHISYTTTEAAVTYYDRVRDHLRELDGFHDLALQQATRQTGVTDEVRWEHDPDQRRTLNQAYLNVIDEAAAGVCLALGIYDAEKLGVPPQHKAEVDEAAILRRALDRAAG